MNVYLPNLRLPSEYQEVEWIQGTGTQYINTGFIPNQNTKVDIGMSGFSVFQRGETLFGVRYSWSADASVGRGFGLIRNTVDNTTGAMFGRKYTGDGEGMGGYTFHDGNYHTINMSQSGIYEDGILRITLNTVTFTSPGNLYIFADNDNGTINEQGAFKLYYFKIRDNGTLVRNFIPCYRKSDNVIGLYDLVNSAFYTNAGSGTFSKGNDVTMAELKNAYIGYSYTPNSHTKCWYKFANDMKDYSGNDTDFYQYSGATTYSNNMITTTGELRKNTPSFSGGYSGNFTVMCWVDYSAGTIPFIALFRAGYPTSSGISMPDTNNYLWSVYIGGSWKSGVAYGGWTGIHHLALVRNDNNLYGYLDGVQQGSSVSASGGLNSTLTGGNVQSGRYGETIAEDIARSQPDIQKYFNNMKGYYGIS